VWKEQSVRIFPDSLAGRILPNAEKLVKTYQLTVLHWVTEVIPVTDDHVLWQTCAYPDNLYRLLNRHIPIPLICLIRDEDNDPEHEDRILL
jgi:hypothetical protein